MHATDLPDRSTDHAEDEPRETWVEPALPAPAGIEGQYRRAIDSDGHTTVTIEVTMTDPELAAMEICLATLQTLPYATRVRILSYIRQRVESDPEVWGNPEPPPAPEPVTRREVAERLAQVDGHDWAVMTPVAQSPYYRRAEAVTTGELTVIRRDA